MTLFLVYIFPISGILFVVNMVSIIKKVHQNDMDTSLNTFLATLGFILTVAAIIFTY